MTKLKVCGITNPGDARECARLGVDFIGFVFAPSPRQIAPEAALEIARLLGSAVKTVGVFTQEGESVAQIAGLCKLDYIQLHGDQSDRLAQNLGAERVIRAVRISDANSINTISSYPSACYYLLDSYSKNAKGGTGTTWDWKLISEPIIDKPIFLAGGIDAENVAEAIQRVNPFAVDVSSGVEAMPGKKDIVKLERLVRNVRECG